MAHCVTSSAAARIRKSLTPRSDELSRCRLENRVPLFVPDPAKFRIADRPVGALASDGLLALLASSLPIHLIPGHTRPQVQCLRQGRPKVRISEETSLSEAAEPLPVNRPRHSQIPAQ